jgi:hypothetical protein
MSIFVFINIDMNKKIFEQRSVGDQVLARIRELARNEREVDPNSNSGLKPRQPRFNPRLIDAIRERQKAEAEYRKGGNLDIRA